MELERTVNYDEETRRRDMAQEMEGRGLTLDGKPAVIIGFQRRFAYVRQADGHIGAEWAWPTLFKMNEGKSNTLSM